MATDLERLVVQLSADIKGYENALRRAQGVTTRQTRQIERRFETMNRNISAGFMGLSRGFIGAFAGVAGARAFTQLLDASTRIENALKVAGLAGEELTRVHDRLFESAQRNAAPLESLVTLYGRAAIVQKELGVTTEELLGFTENVAMALRVAGTDAQSASGALLQLSQALGSGVVRAEEFNSILEGALPIAQAAAAGLEEAGGSVARLRALVVDGAVSSEAFFRAFEAGSIILEEKVAGAELTVSQSFVRLQNVLIATAQELDSGSDASGRLAEAIDWLATSIDGLDFSGAINGALNFAESLVGVINTIREYARAAGEATGAAKFGPWLRSKMGGGEAAQELTPDAIRDWAARNGIGPSANTTPKAGRLPSASGPVRTVSLADFMPPSSGGGGGGGSRGRGGGGRSGAAKARDELREAAEAARELERAERDAERAAEDLGSAAGDALGSLADALGDGKIEARELLDIVRNLARQLLSMPGVGGGGFFSGFLSSILHDGGVAGVDGGKRRVHPALFSGAPRYHSGGVAGLRPGEIPAILQRGEIVIPKGQARAAAGGNFHVTVGVAADGNGNLMPFVQSVAQSEAGRATASLGKRVPQMVDQRTDARRARRVRA